MASRSTIRRLFLEPKRHYSLSKAAKLLEMKEKDLRGWVAAGEIEAVEVDGKEVIPWAEVVSFAIDLWSQEEIEAALGAEVAEAIPELLRLTELEVRIPRLEVLALEHVAMRDGRSVGLRPFSGAARLRLGRVGVVESGDSRFPRGTGVAGCIVRT